MPNELMQTDGGFAAAADQQGVSRARGAMSSVPRDVEQDFFASRRSATVPFVINDAVIVLRGPHEGRAGSVISILSVEPDLELLVELEDGTDVPLLAKQVRRLDDAG